jgi:hypothetical protein
MSQFYLEAVGLTRYHYPRPMRFVWHHILPQACGGKSTKTNLIAVCDNCHYATHILMWYLANGGIPVTVKYSRAQLRLAQQGYQAAVAAGTVSKMPKEAS